MLMLMVNLFLAFFFSMVMILLIFFVSKKSNLDREKLSPFECGFSTMSESRNPISLRFFLVTLIFLVFDIELILLFPFIFKIFYSLTMPGLGLFIIFLSLLSVGLFLEWNQMMLEWN